MWCCAAARSGKMQICTDKRWSDHRVSRSSYYLAKGKRSTNVYWACYFSANVRYTARYLTNAEATKHRLVTRLSAMVKRSAWRPGERIDRYTRTAYDELSYSSKTFISVQSRHNINLFGLIPAGKQIQLRCWWSCAVV